MPDDPFVGMMEAVEALEVCIVGVVSYRSKLVEAGFSDTMAERMCADLHAGLMRTAFPYKHQGAST